MVLDLTQDIEKELEGLPLIDAHTHLVGGHLGARGLEDLLLYHMVASDLYAAGCPSGARLTPFPGRPSREEAQRRIREAIPYLPHIRNTSMSWALRRMLEDLHGWREPIDERNWPRLDAMIRERSGDRAWHHEILDRLHIARTVTEIARRGHGEDDDRLHYSLEWAFFTRAQWGEFDTALYELERCWDEEPESPTPIGVGIRAPSRRTIRTVDDVDAAIRHYAGAIPYDRVISTATHISTDIEFRDVSDDDLARALARRDAAGEAERDIYASAIHERFLTALEGRADRIVFQFSLGAEPLPYETGARLSQRTIAELGAMIARHPRLRFQCFNACAHANQALCTLARELPNLSLAGYWWHTFFPSFIRRIIEERLDMLPVNKQIGFFSDAYVVEWVYGKAILVRKALAQVLAQKIAQGEYGRDDAISIARSILFESPQALLGIAPRG